MSRIARSAYAEMFGPTTGDRIRLADTELFIEIEHDHATYGEEVKFGGGKVIRDGMGQSQLIAGEGMLVTAGGIDAHIHFICPQQIEEALMSGITTMLGGGTGPAVGTAATPARRGRGTCMRCCRRPMPSR